MKNMGISRAIGLGVLMAVVGFSYSMASFDDEVVGGPTVEARGISSFSSDLRFTNPFLEAGLDPDYPLAGDSYNPAVYDLGDAVVGTYTITRYITAADGVPPYTFASTNLGTLAPSLDLSANGLLAGSVPAGLSGQLRFNVTVTDSYTGGTNTKTGLFRIGLVSSTDFRFLVSKLNGGSLGQDYVAKLDTYGGALPITFSVVSGTVKVGTTSYSSLEDIGLTVMEDGTVAGRPLVAGTVTFTAKAVDAAGGVALGRSPATTENQVMTIEVEDNEVVASSITTTKSQLKYDVEKSNKDLLKLDCYVNLQGNGVADLNGKKLTVRIGGKTVVDEQAFDDKGKIKVKNADKTDNLKVKVQTNRGRLRLTLNKTDLSDVVGSAVADGGTKTLVVQVVIEDVVVASEVLKYEAKVRGSKIQLKYKLAKDGQALAGAFQILQVKGADKDTGDKWKVKFLAVPRMGIDSSAGLNHVSSALVMVGSDFSKTYTSTDTEGGNVKFRESSSNAQFTDKRKTGLKKVKIDNKRYVSSVQTNVLATTDTGIAQAESSSSNDNFALAFQVTRSVGDSFTGVTGKVIAKKGKKGWSDSIK